MPATFGGIEFEFIWRAFAVAATTGSITPEAEADALNKGWVLLDLPTTSSAGLPDDFLKNFEG